MRRFLLCLAFTGLRASPAPVRDPCSDLCTRDGPEICSGGSWSKNGVCHAYFFIGNPLDRNYCYHRSDTASSCPDTGVAVQPTDALVILQHHAEAQVNLSPEDAVRNILESMFQNPGDIVVLREPLMDAILASIGSGGMMTMHRFASLGTDLIYRLADSSDEAFELLWKPALWLSTMRIPEDLTLDEFAFESGLAGFCERNEVRLRNVILDDFHRRWHVRPIVPPPGMELAAQMMFGAAANIHLFCPDVVDSLELRSIIIRQRAYQTYLGMGPADPLNIFVHHEQVLLESLQLLTGPAENIRAGLGVVQFVEGNIFGEGPRTEWFRSFSRELYDPVMGLLELRRDEAPHHTQFSLAEADTPHEAVIRRAAGRFLALTLLEGRKVDVSLPLAFFAKLLDQRLTLDEIRHDEPALVESLDFVRAATPDELADLELEIGGIIQAVTPDNMQQLIDERIDSLIPEDALEAYLGVAEGFNEIIPLESLRSVVTADELRDLLYEAPALDVDDFIAHAELQGYEADSPQIAWLQNALHAFNEPTRAGFLRFVTGSELPPSGGFRNLGRSVLITRGVDPSHLPSAAAAMRQLHLPPYQSEENLHDRLLIAITHFVAGIRFTV